MKSSHRTPIQNALVEFNRTNQIGEELLIGFDQNGEWQGIPSINPFIEILYDTEITLAMERLKTKRVNPEQMVKTDPITGGEILKGSYIETKNTKMAIPYQEIRGQLKSPQKEFQAPNLRTVGCMINLPEVKTIHAPKLQRMERLYCPNVWHLNLPSLETCDRYIQAHDVRSTQLPKLQTLGETIEIPKATSVDIPHINPIQISAPLAQIFQETRNGELHLLCSALYDYAEPPEIPFHHIHGKLMIVSIGEERTLAGNKPIHAPNLRTVGKTFGAPNSEKIHAENLESVGGAFIQNENIHVKFPKLKSVTELLDCMMATQIELPTLEHVGGLGIETAPSVHLPKLKRIEKSLMLGETKSITAPNLEFIGENLDARSATFIQMGKLRHIGNRADTQNCPTFYDTRIHVGTNWEIHSNAIDNWKQKKREQEKIKNTPDLHI